MIYGMKLGMKFQIIRNGFVKKNVYIPTKQVRPVREILPRKKKDFKSMHRIVGNPFIKTPRRANVSRLNPLRPNPPRLNFHREFDFINVSEESSNIPKNIITRQSGYKVPAGFQLIPIPTVFEHEDKEIEHLLNVCTVLSEHGGIYLNQSLKIPPTIFLKNRESVFASSDFFACEKDSSVMKNVLQELKESNDKHRLVDIFKRDSYVFNDSFRFLV